MTDGRVVFLHDFRNKQIIDGKKTVIEEYVIEGSKGLMIKYYHKDGDDVHKVVIVKKDNTYFMRVTHNAEKAESEVTKDVLIKELKKNKNLKFALDYIQNQKGGKRGSRKSSRK